MDESDIGEGVEGGEGKTVGKSENTKIEKRKNSECFKTGDEIMVRNNKGLG